MTQDIVGAIINHLQVRPALLGQIVLGQSTLGEVNPDLYGLTGNRVYRKRLPIDVQYPAIAVRKITDIRPNESSGPYSMARIQISTLATDDGMADRLSELVADRLNKAVNTVIGHISVVGIDDGGARPGANQDSGIEVYHRDFMVEYCYI